MEFLIVLLIGLVTAILVLPFVALAKANRAKRAVDRFGQAIVIARKRTAQSAAASRRGCENRNVRVPSVNSEIRRGAACSCDTCFSRA